MMISKRMALLYSKAAVIIFVLCFTVVQLASIHRKEELDKPNHPVSVDSKLADHMPVPNDNNNVKRFVMTKKPSPDIVSNPHKSENKDDAQPVDNDNFGNNQNEVIIKEEAQILGRGDLGPEKTFVQNQPNKADDVVIGAGGELQIQEPKEKKAALQREEEEEEEEEEEDDEFPGHNLKDIRKLKLEELELPDHMDGVRLEIDGHLNKEYKKEIILGNHEEFEEQSDVEPEKLLEEVFNKVDKNSDHFITLMELQEWIIKKVQEHFDEANEETERIFSHLDTDNKGYVTWHNFHIHFLVSKGHDVNAAIKHATDYETIPLEPDEKERLIHYKFRWAEADNNPQDNKLNIEEFKSFRHPEQSKTMLDRMIQDILDNLDQNSDGEITEEEFVALPPGELDGAFADSDRVWQNERRNEFRNVIDMNRDGKVTRLELKNYVDPKNPNHARLEAENLMQLADENKDSQLSLNEVLDNTELFLGSKVVDIGRNFHDEF